MSAAAVSWWGVGGGGGGSDFIHILLCLAVDLLFFQTYIGAILNCMHVLSGLMVWFQLYGCGSAVSIIMMYVLY